MNTQKTLAVALALAATIFTTGSAEARQIMAIGGTPRAAMAEDATAQGGKDDPAYGMYKQAYELILKEDWAKARKAFEELAEKYPSSEYRDDAAYWTAYSWKDVNQDRAKKAYREFLDKYRNSSYFDDALADIDQIMARTLAATPAITAVRTMPPTPSMPSTPRVSGAAGVGHAVTVPGVAVTGVRTPYIDDSAFGMTVRGLPAPAIAPVIKMRHLGRMLRVTTPGRPLTVAMGDDDEIDTETKLRLEALYAVGRTGEDEKGFTALKNVAVSQSEKPVVRVAAMEALADYRRHDAIPVYVEIARKDTSEEMQLYAIESIGNASRDREKAYDALIKLYGSVPASEVGKRKMVFYSIAETGSDRAVDFLADVAKNGTDPDLRREAVYYLGTIGGEKSRAVLIDILKK